jgi:hypothetical protein
MKKKIENSLPVEGEPHEDERVGETLNTDANGSVT